MSDEGFYRSASATPGLFIIEQKVVQRCEINMDAQPCKAL